jgi:hypothetical protein
MKKLLAVAALIGAVVFVVEFKKRQGFSCAGGVCTLSDATRIAQAIPEHNPCPACSIWGSANVSHAK